MSKKSGDPSGNVGEWSELYVVLKLLADGVLRPGDSQLNPIPNAELKVLSVSRNDAKGDVHYRIEKEIVVISSPGKSSKVRVSECEAWATALLTQIKTKSKQKGAKSIPETATWMAALGATSLKAKSSNKSDVEISLHDLHTGAAPRLGFSVKSYLGQVPTLLNPSQQTNFTYPLTSCDAELLTSFNSTRVGKKKSYRAALQKLPTQPLANDAAIDSLSFRKNLNLIDGQLAPILSNLALLYYQGQADSDLVTLCKLLEHANPLGVEADQIDFFYKYKIKRFLVCVALGLTPGKLWRGEYFANGGYVVIKKDGSLISYHVYTPNQFEDYLFANTCLDTPSSRNKFGEIYQSANAFFLKLNLQIRFLKR